MGWKRRISRGPDSATADGTGNAYMSQVLGSKTDTARGLEAATRSLMSYVKGIGGLWVAGTTDTSPLASMDLWSTNGMVEIHEIIGIVATVIQTQATTIQLQFDPDDGGTDVDLCAAGTDATADAVGTIYRLTKDFSEDIIALLDAMEATDIQAPPIILSQAGDIKVAYGATSTGVINWYCKYKPITGVLVAG